ncbi:hypothetical protein F5877DRAFT_85629 [Lentinula edodes]|nr:hypothetical protein F5877DRAFT_85629 [Lentinula edodes]
MMTPPASTSAGASHAPDAPPSPPNRRDSDVDEISTNSTSALLELNPLNDQDQRELDRQELCEFHQHQPLVPGPSPLVPRTSLVIPRSPIAFRKLVHLSSLCLELEASHQSLEEVAVDHAEYQRVLSQFQAIEAELPEPSSEDLLTCFRIAHSEVDTYREVAKCQKKEIGELRKQVDDATSHSSNAYTELDSANARVLAHVAKGLIRQYPEDEGLYEVELPSLSELQRKLDASEALVRWRSLGGHHPPTVSWSPSHSRMSFLHRRLWFTHGELHLRSTSSLLYNYSNAADRVEGLYQEMLTHSHFPSHDAFLTAAQHAGYVDARPGSLEPPLHRRFFSFDHPIPITSSPTSDHLPTIPALDSIMVSWERLIANYIRDMIDTPGLYYLFPTSTELPGVGGGPSPLGGSVLAEGDGRTVPREVAEVAGETGIAVHPNVATPEEEDTKELPVVGSETPLFLPASRSRLSPLLFPSVPVVPNIIDLTMVDDDGEDLYESREEFDAKMQGDVAVKDERSSPALQSSGSPLYDFAIFLLFFI